MCKKSDQPLPNIYIKPKIPQVDYSIERILKIITESEKNYDTPKIVAAYNLANKCHDGQKRESGEKYIIHPLAVANILLDLGMDTDTLCAALLHDVVEDTNCTLGKIRNDFGTDVANLVDGVTKVTSQIQDFPNNKDMSDTSKEIKKATSLRKILFAMAEDFRVIIIKLADRVHNMRTLNFCSDDKRRRIAFETLTIYAPIADQLGINTFKNELQDLSIYYLDPYGYQEIEEQIFSNQKQRQSVIDNIIDELTKRFKNVFKKPPVISGRVKSVYSLYNKIYKHDKEFEQVFDTYAVRIIVDSISECYHSLGIVHEMFTVLPERFKDYISAPKENGYRSIHTTVIGHQGITFEVQIRTHEMHEDAEYGIAAHWKYKENNFRKDDLDSRLNWARRIIESQQESNDVEEIFNAIKSDVAAEMVVAYTPSGETISLPNGATPIDFAYRIHTQVGHNMIGAKINGKMVSFDHEIQTGNIVEIITTNAENHGPSRSWMNICKTTAAKSKIRSWFKKEKREENIFEGKSALEREFRRNNIRIPENELATFLEPIMKRHSCNTFEDLFAAIGYGGILISKIMPRIKNEYLKQFVKDTAENEKATISTTNNQTSQSGVIVDGNIDNCLIKFAQCCTPLPGDPIIGFITKGHGISIHKLNCTNYINQSKNEADKARWIPCQWAEHRSSGYFKATIVIIAIDRIGLLADVTSVLSAIHILIHESSSRNLKNGNACVTVTISVADTAQLKTVVDKLSKVKSVISVDRPNTYNRDNTSKK